ncbi:hypothetical protein LV457_11005 [Mycobacterium sp. MYCO198283]|uniref:hypothetical protein n=1 Tax=Mycobacterium sp. MYCO198283 TaxID=2883505 RepID=UPI001E521F2A|nr:hypothetical protein [Mycobacterium sp. MYCO198283]MCG5432812.1 hypothetical protein [Mycobacterium sp. MYCO198283]
MTWLFVLFTPLLLMGATFGLNRLEQHIGEASRDAQRRATPAAAGGRAALSAQANPGFRPTRHPDPV